MKRSGTGAFMLSGRDHIASSVTRPALLPALTALRGPLAWLIVFFHFSVEQPIKELTGGVSNSPLSNAYFAVECFYLVRVYIVSRAFQNRY